MERITSLDETLTYNDFYWTNLAVSSDRKEALMFDYNLLGVGFRYNDIRNVCSSLSEEAQKVFVDVYGEIKGVRNALYTTGVDRTGCMFCMFGCHLDKEPNRFQRMKITHPKQWDYCINKLGCGRVLDFIGVPYE
jgi:hypothetical protein